jgi:hypothetical protein
MPSFLRRSHLANNEDGMSEAGEGIDKSFLRGVTSDFEDGDDDSSLDVYRRNICPFDAAHGICDTFGGGGTIRMEGWLNHTTSSQRIHAPSAAASSTSSNAATVITSATSESSSSSSSSMLSKTVSKKTRQSSMRKQPRYFVLRGSTLSYYARRHDVKAKGTFVITRGCSVGPVVLGSLDDPLMMGTVVAAAGGVGGVGVGETSDHPTTSIDGREKSKKKKRQFYCVQLTWSIKEKPSKAEQVIAQAKAQVAAEREKEAMQQQQQQIAVFQTASPKLEDGGGGGEVQDNNNNMNGSRSPMLQRTKQLVRRAKSESCVPAGSARARPPAVLTVDDSENDCIGGGDSVHGRQLHPPTNPPAVKQTITKGVSQPSALSSESQAADPPFEAGPHKHYKHQIEKRTRDQQKSAEESQKVKELLTRREMYQRTKKRMIQGTKVAAVGTVAVTTGLLTAGAAAPAIALVVFGITAAAGGSGAMVGSKVFDKAQKRYDEYRSQKSFHLLIGASTYEEAMKWKLAIEYVINELANESDEGSGDVDQPGWITRQPSLGEHEGGDYCEGPAFAPKISPKIGTNGAMVDYASKNSPCHDTTPKWVPIQSGGMALWGLGGGGGNLRIHREELYGRSPYYPFPAYFGSWFSSQQQTSSFTTIPELGLGLSDQPFPPFKASMEVKSTSLDAFMCLMCSGRMPNEDLYDSGNGNGGGAPNSGQIASFRVLETIDDHMDVIHLVFRPLYLFPSWTAPRDFVLFRFWKYDDDGTYQICYDSGEHRDCPEVQGYVRGEMHSVYTIAPLKWKKKRAATDGGSLGATTTSASSKPSVRPNILNEECLLSLVVQINPKGWVPSTAYIPFFRNQGYGDAFAIMALHQMLDIKEALNSARFVAVPMDVTHYTSLDEPHGARMGSWKLPKRLLASGKPGSSEFYKAHTRQVRNIAAGGAMRARAESGQWHPFFSFDEDAGHNSKFSGVNELNPADQYNMLLPSTNNDVNAPIDGAHLSANKSRKSDLSSISTIPPPTM